MDIQKETKYRARFVKLLYDLSISENVLESSEKRKEFFKRIEELYHSEGGNEEFRHYYSDIFSVLTNVQQEEDLGNINYLGQNLDIIRRKYRAVNTDKNGKLIDVSNNIKKLYDHVSLDIARITYSDGADYKITQNESIIDLRSKITALQGKISNTNKSLRKTDKKIQSSQREYIAILGIFSSILLTFIGGIVFSSSVLQNIHNASIYRIIIVCLTIGIVLVNVMFFLFYYIERIVFDKRENKGKLFYFINIILIALMIVTCICWYFGVVEGRNSTFSKNTSISTSSTHSSYTNNTESTNETQKESK